MIEISYFYCVKVKTSLDFISITKLIQYILFNFFVIESNINFIVECREVKGATPRGLSVRGKSTCMCHRKRHIQVSCSHALRNNGTNAKIATSCGNAFMTNIVLASRSVAERILIDNYT